MTNEYLNQTALGEHFGVSSHVIGKWLKDVGLREGRAPSYWAHKNGFCRKEDTGRGAAGGYYWIWQAQKTIRELEKAGHSPVGKSLEAPLDPPPVPLGPFTTGQTASGMIELTGSDGAVVALIAGRETAERMAQILTLAFHCGKFDPPPANQVTA